MDPVDGDEGRKEDWGFSMNASWPTAPAYITEQVKPQHSFRRVRPVFVTYGVEVCCPLEVVFFSFTGAVKKNQLLPWEQQLWQGLKVNQPDI